MMSKDIAVNIAVILTCFNRKAKTLSCLEHLYAAQKAYNSQNKHNISLAVYLTDDGCTDGTSDAVTDLCTNFSQELHIVKGNGSCFWAGGMRLAWTEALKKHNKWQFYLLLNDDTMVYENVFMELFYAHSYSIKQYGKPGIYSGITCDVNDKERITYGGDVFVSGAKGKWKRLGTSDNPQLVDQTNANILLVSKEVVDKVGIFYKGYIHGCADYDYGMTVRRNGLPALVTAKVCGTCEYDHITDGEETHKLMSMSLSQRIQYVYAPTHSDKDYLLYVKRNIPHKYIISWTLRKIRMLFPYVYYNICKSRGLNSYK